MTHSKQVVKSKRREEYDWEDVIKVMEETGLCQTDCSEGCMVEADGICPHGCPSIMLKFGMI